MSSYLERQKAAFQGSLDSAASKISTKKTTLAPPSPALSASSATGSGKKRKAEDEGSPSGTSTAGKAGATSQGPGPAQSSIYPSEPISYGSDLLTQLTFVVDYLKRKGDDPKTLDDVLSHLSLLSKTDEYKARMADRLRNHPRIQWVPDPGLSEQTWRTGAYVHRPLIPGVRDRESLVAHLQRSADSRGLSVKDLKDGWPDCEDDIAALERAHRILVIRTKKDNHPRLVWVDDPRAANPVDADYAVWFHRVELPGAPDIPKCLKDVGQKSASEGPKAEGQKQAAKAPKKRAQKRPGKLTNSHMEKLLKNYSEYRKP